MRTTRFTPPVTPIVSYVTTSVMRITIDILSLQIVWAAVIVTLSFFVCLALTLSYNIMRPTFSLMSQNR